MRRIGDLMDILAQLAPSARSEHDGSSRASVAIRIR